MCRLQAATTRTTWVGAAQRCRHKPPLTPLTCRLKGRFLPGRGFHSLYSCRSRAFTSGRLSAAALAALLAPGDWPVSRATFQAQGVTVDNIGAAVHDMLLTTTPRIDLSRHPSATTVVVEISFACLKYGYYREGVISEAIQEQAVLAATGYMEQLLPVELRHPAASYVSPTALHAPASA